MLINFQSPPYHLNSLFKQLGQIVKKDTKQAAFVVRDERSVLPDVLFAQFTTFQDGRLLNTDSDL